MRRLSFARLVVLVAVVAGIGPLSVSSASAAGSGAENFTVSGSWSCTSNCTLRGAWGIQGRVNTCLETEAEVVDLQAALPCSGAYFTGTINSTCVLNTCVEQGQVDFYLPDASDPGTTIGPVTVGVVGTAQLVTLSVGTTREQGYVLAAGFEAVDQSAGPQVASVDAGVLAGAGCSGTPFGCEFPQTFATTLTGVNA